MYKIILRSVIITVVKIEKYVLTLILYTFFPFHNCPLSISAHLLISLSFINKFLFSNHQGICKGNYLNVTMEFLKSTGNTVITARQLFLP
jgi:hypothetical protein